MSAPTEQPRRVPVTRRRVTERYLPLGHIDFVAYYTDAWPGGRAVRLYQYDLVKTPHLPTWLERVFQKWIHGT